MPASGEFVSVVRYERYEENMARLFQTVFVKNDDY
jgi:hypothetical protein